MASGVFSSLDAVFLIKCWVFGDALQAKDAYERILFLFERAHAIARIL